MRKKIGVVTWVDGANFGGFLQAFATDYYLKHQGYDVVFLQYKKKFHVIKHYIGSLLLVRMDVAKSRIKKHRLLKKNITVKVYSSYEKLKRDATGLMCCICGSDQIWNIEGCERDKFVLLDFIRPDKRIALAPSISHTEISNSAAAYFKKYLPEFYRLSVREQNGYDIIKKNTDLEAKLLFDPVFLLTKDEWIHIADRDQRFADRQYTLVYLLTDNAYYYDLIKKYAKENKTEVIQINLKRDVHPVFPTLGCDPFDFISLIRHAQHVFTDSFHGLSFSLILNKEFTLFKRFKDDAGSENSRIYNILYHFGLQNHLVSDDMQAMEPPKTDIDFASVNKTINKERMRLMQYLDEAIKQYGTEEEKL